MQYDPEEEYKPACYSCFCNHCYTFTLQNTQTFLYLLKSRKSWQRYLGYYISFDIGYLLTGLSFIAFYYIQVQTDVHVCKFLVSSV